MAKQSFKDNNQQIQCYDSIVSFFHFCFSFPIRAVIFFLDFTRVEQEEAEWVVLMWSAATSGCGDSSFLDRSDWMMLPPQRQRQQQQRAGGIVPDDVTVVVVEAGAANRQCKAEADTADSRRRKAEAAVTFRQV